MIPGTSAKFDKLEVLRFAEPFRSNWDRTESYLKPLLLAKDASNGG